MVNTSNYLYVMFDNGESWRIPLLHVITLRARAFVEESGVDFDYSSESFDKALDEAIDLMHKLSDYELIKWARNEIVWDEVESHAEQTTETEDYNYNQNWANAKMKIQEAG